MQNKLISTQPRLHKLNAFYLTFISGDDVVGFYEPKSRRVVVSCMHSNHREAMQCDRFSQLKDWHHFTIQKLCDGVVSVLMNSNYTGQVFTDDQAKQCHKDIVGAMINSKDYTVAYSNLRAFRID